MAHGDEPQQPCYAIKAAIAEPAGDTYRFAAAKTMYGGKRIAAGDLLFVFHSENSGGRGLFALSEVVSAEAVPLRPDLARQTPRVTVVARRLSAALRPLGRAELKGWTDWQDGRPETELNFKFYRQATDKIVGLSPGTAAFLHGFFG